MRLFRNLGQPAFLKDISEVFGRRVRKFGDTPAGVLWKDTDGQRLRFEVLAGILDGWPPSQPLRINDFGCGYGALFDFLDRLPAMPEMTYHGYDICEEMIHAAWHRIGDRRATFTEASNIDVGADFTFVSGTYNLKLDTADKPWNAYVKSSLRQLWVKTEKGLAFNMLDVNHPDRGDGLYYADAEEFMEFCSGLSANITLIDDYPLHEWTLFVRR